MKQQIGRPRKSAKSKLVVRSVAIYPQDDVFLKGLEYGEAAELQRNAISSAVARERRKTQTDEKAPASDVGEKG